MTTIKKITSIVGIIALLSGEDLATEIQCITPIPYQAPGSHSEAFPTHPHQTLKAELLEHTKNFDMEQLFRKEEILQKIYEIENPPTTRRERLLAEAACRIGSAMLENREAAAALPYLGYSLSKGYPKAIETLYRLAYEPYMYKDVNYNQISKDLSNYAKVLYCRACEKYGQPLGKLNPLLKYFKEVWDKNFQAVEQKEAEEAELQRQQQWWTLQGVKHFVSSLWHSTPSPTILENSQPALNSEKAEAKRQSSKRGRRSSQEPSNSLRQRKKHEEEQQPLLTVEETNPFMEHDTKKGA